MFYGTRSLERGIFSRRGSLELGIL